VFRAPRSGVKSRNRRVAWAIIAAAALAPACGKKGPPLPPLLKVPVAPGDFAAERRGTEVSVQFTVPAANTDGSRPANVSRVDLYRYTGPSAVTDDQLLKLATNVARLTVRAPRDPDITTEPGEPAEEPDLEEEGLEPGSIARVEDELESAEIRPTELPASAKPKTAARESSHPGPLVGPSASVPAAIYVAVGFNRGGRRGPLSRRIAVPLVPPPRPPASPKIDYDEMRVHISWMPSPSAATGQEAPPETVLPSRTIGLPARSVSYHVYEVSPAPAASGGDAQALASVGQVRLTPSPVSADGFDDRRMEWGATRCYTVRTVETIGGLALESDPPPPACTTLVDTFPPSPPRDLKAVAVERAINLIWEPNSEPDLAGYIVLRGAWPGETLVPITPAPIRDPSFTDAAEPGHRYVYAVQAVDKAGNVSAASDRADDTAR
jgi:hypothetical protein